MDNKWFGRDKRVSRIMDGYKNCRLKKVSWKFSNFKVRTIIRTEVTEGNPPQTVTQEQMVEPGCVYMRYKHNKYNDATNPGLIIGTDRRIEENMHSKCITNCEQGIWGVFKPLSAIALSYLPNPDESLIL